MKFDEIIGNTEVKEYLVNSVKSNNILHSYLFSGTEGIGKSLIAQEFAKKILCFGEENCKSCVSFDGNNHPDYIFVNEESIKIDAVRKLIEKVYEKPILSKKKVYIINNCDKMTVEAQNCLLKTLEEPPEFIVIILITSNENSILSTIKSRCMTIKFQNISETDLLNYCKNVLEYEDLSNNLLKVFNGSIGNAIRLKSYKDKYEKIDIFINKLKGSSLIDIMQNKDIFDKECINEILDYMTVVFYNQTNDKIRYLNCINYINECQLRLKTYSNFDMTIDNLLFKIWEELNENRNRC